MITANSSAKIILGVLVVILLAAPALAITLPSSLQNLQSQNEQNTQRFVTTITFFVAFMAGIVSFVSPCMLPVFPAFFAYAFKQKRDLQKATLAFSAGMISSMVMIGLIAAYIGRLLLDDYRANLIFGMGVFFLVLGFYVASGKSFGFNNAKSKVDTSSLWSIAAFGFLFGVGFTPCIGPIFSGILAIAMVMGDYVWSGLLFAFYAAGMAFPLYILSVYYDRWRLHEKHWMRGKEYTFMIAGKRFETHSHNLIAGAILLFFGVLFTLHQGTYIFNGWAAGNLSHYFYMFNDALISGDSSWYWASLGVFALASVFVAYSFVVRVKR